MAFLFCGPLQAVSLTVELRDNDGKPLSEAVVWIEPAAGDPAAGDPAAPQGRLPAEQPLVMDQQRRLFTPYILPVQRGTRVIFPNSDPINHHVYSFSPAKRFELRLHHQGDSAQEVTFDKAGLVTLGCNIHDWMLGFILVLDSPWFAQTDAEGRARLDYQPAAGQRLHVWHPRIGDAPENLVRPVEQPGTLRIQLTERLKRDPRPKPPIDRPRGKGGYVP
nr:methylamine utilization protein [uncultured Pseudomonas sp.]